jgi:hypothetical protein
LLAFAAGVSKGLLSSKAANPQTVFSSFRNFKELFSSKESENPEEHAGVAGAATHRSSFRNVSQLFVSKALVVGMEVSFYTIRSLLTLIRSLLTLIRSTYKEVLSSPKKLLRSLSGMSTVAVDAAAADRGRFVGFFYMSLSFSLHRSLYGNS